MNKKSFILYQDQSEIINKLSNEQAGRLIKAIFKYANGEEPKLTPYLSIIFVSFKQTLIRDSEKWENIVDRNRKNIKSRWSKEKQPQKNTKSTSGISGIPNTLDSDSDSDIAAAKISTKNGTSKDIVKRLTELLGDSYKFSDSKHYRKNKSGWGAINNPTAYLKTIENTSAPVETQHKIDGATFDYEKQIIPGKIS